MYENGKNPEDHADPDYNPSNDFRTPLNSLYRSLLKRTLGPFCLLFKVVFLDFL